MDGEHLSGLPPTLGHSSPVAAQLPAGGNIKYSIDILRLVTQQITEQLVPDAAFNADVEEIESLGQQLLLLAASCDVTYEVALGFRHEDCPGKNTERGERDFPHEHDYTSQSSVSHADDDMPLNQELVEVFKEIDVDKNGRIEVSELCNALRVVGLPRALSAKLIRLADADQSGEIDFDEWVAVLRRCQDKDLALFRDSLVHTKSKATDGTVFDSDQKHHPCMLHPLSVPRLVWDFFIAVMCLYVTISEPFFVAFEGGLSSVTIESLAFADRFTECVFLLDILLNFRTGYIDEDTRNVATVELDWRLAAKHYMRTWLLLDLLSAFPFSLLVASAPTDLQFAKALKASKFMKLTRLLKSVPAIRRIEDSDVYEDFIKYPWVRFVYRRSFVLWLLIIVCHMMACVMKLIDEGFLSSGYETVTSEYIAAFYWCMTTLTTVGYGDITPVTNAERLFAVAAMVVGGGFYGVVVGLIGEMVKENDLNATAFYSRMDLIHAWSVHHNLPRRTRIAVCRYFRHFLSEKSAMEEADVWQDLSPELQKEVSDYIVHDDVRYNPIFDGVSLGAVVKVHSILHRCTAGAGQSIVKRGDPGTTMYIIRVGKVTLEHSSDLQGKQQLRTLLPGQSFGEEVVVGYLDRYEYDVTTSAAATFETILQHQLMEIFSCMPHVLERMQRNASEMDPRLRQRPST
eukprot:TRINITY_DN107452_c0_g1_i1.p1 TRINITY_DN107452_c0_g1~~TRINITY_DN107452_c0_g1_i1.p1  ORF type:complete len:685 (-),score=109.46 TRINITY_DN107452_c0_g1_i1:239-2293(-)